MSYPLGPPPGYFFPSHSPQQANHNMYGITLPPHPPPPEQMYIPASMMPTHPLQSHNTAGYSYYTSGTVPTGLHQNPFYQPRNTAVVTPFGAYSRSHSHVQVGSRLSSSSTGATAVPIPAVDNTKSEEEQQQKVILMYHRLKLKLRCCMCYFDIIQGGQIINCGHIYCTECLDKHYMESPIHICAVFGCDAPFNRRVNVEELKIALDKFMKALEDKYGKIPELTPEVLTPSVIESESGGCAPHSYAAAAGGGGHSSMFLTGGGPTVVQSPLAPNFYDIWGSGKPMASMGYPHHQQNSNIGYAIPSTSNSTPVPVIVHQIPSNESVVAEPGIGMQSMSPMGRGDRAWPSLSSENANEGFYWQEGGNDSQEQGNPLFARGRSGRGKRGRGQPLWEFGSVM